MISVGDTAASVALLARQRPALDDLVLRSMARGEEDLVHRLFTAVSSRSAYFRFHAATPRLSEGRVRQLVRREPGQREATVAILSGEPVGHGMWIREANAAIAEVAIVVADGHQGTHVGHALLLDLARTAREVGLLTFRCVVHPENRRLQSQLVRLGATGPTDRTDYLLDLSLL